VTTNALTFASKIRFLTDIQSSPVADSNLQDFADVFTLPETDGTADQVLKTGSGGVDSASVTSLITTTVDSAYVVSKLTASEIYTRTVITATAGQTAFSATYTVGYVDVFVNGIKTLNTTDYTATNGTSITLNTALSAGDLVEIVSWVPTALVGVDTGGITTGKSIAMAIVFGG
jgi:hypothetical protein